MNTVVTDPCPSGRTSPGSLPVSPQASGAPRRGLNPSDVAQAEVAFTRALAELPDELRRAGVQLFARLASPNWQMEWGLPRWLAESRGLPESTCARLVAANVLGLGYVRLADDCKDGQAGPLGPEATMRLASAVYDEAISIYAELIGSHAWFWDQFERFLDEWRRLGSDPCRLMSSKPPARRFTL